MWTHTGSFMKGYSLYTVAKFMTCALIMLSLSVIRKNEHWYSCHLAILFVPIVATILLSGLSIMIILYSWVERCSMLSRAQRDNYDPVHAHDDRDHPDPDSAADAEFESGGYRRGGGSAASGPAMRSAPLRPASAGGYLDNIHRNPCALSHYAMGVMGGLVIVTGAIDLGELSPLPVPCDRRYGETFFCFLVGIIILVMLMIELLTQWCFPFRRSYILHVLTYVFVIILIVLVAMLAFRKLLYGNGTAPADEYAFAVAMVGIVHLLEIPVVLYVVLSND